MRSAAAVLTALALVVATGCGDDNGSDGGSGGGVYGGGSATSEEPSGATGSGVVSVDDSSKLGQILVDGDGNTLYLFEKDKGGKSACYGACASVWPPYAGGKPKAEGGAQSGQLGTTERSDGGTQVTYAGFPLYLYVGDKAPGDVNGNDFEQFGAEWYAVTPEGETPED